MIKRLTEGKDLIHIVKLRNDLGDFIEFDRSSWIQWLYNILKNPLFGIFIELDGDTVLSYLVAVHAKVEPLPNTIQVMFWYQKDDSLALLDAVEEWAQEREASRIEVLAKDPSSLRQVGFNVKYIVVERKI